LLSQIHLTNGALSQVDMGPVPTRNGVYDPVTDRLFVSETFGTDITNSGTLAGNDPLRWITLATGAITDVNMDTWVTGGELKGIALSKNQNGRRVYLALRTYDVYTAQTTGVRPTTDLGGALVVMDLPTTANGSVNDVPRIANIVPLDRGASEVRTIQRTGLEDLVAITTPDDGTLTLYDDQVGQVVKVFGMCQGDVSKEPQPCQLGKPMLGAQPFGFVVEPLVSGHVRLYVGSFDRGWVNVIEIDPLNPSAGAVAAGSTSLLSDGVTRPPPWVRIGPERVCAGIEPCDVSPPVLE